MARSNTTPTPAEVLEQLRDLGWTVPDTIRPMTLDEFREDILNQLVRKSRDPFIREDWAALVHMITTVYRDDLARAWVEYCEAHPQ
ncbi:MAG TPA: hypothetical protein VD978_20300 [Azospirillum sp.]|nr:hypothetical protein [Azospirillum sp.]